jgi:hypothetical protein
VSGLDHKLGSLLIDEELKMKDSLFHSLKSLKEELSHDIFDTQVRPQLFMSPPPIAITRVAIASAGRTSLFSFHTQRGA